MVDEETYWRDYCDLYVVLREAEMEYQKDNEQRRLEVQNFKDEIPDAKETKRKLLVERLYLAKKENRPEDAKRLVAESKAFIDSTPIITAYDIVRAKNTPITTLLKVNRVGNISCPFHDDKTPSFQIKKNNTFNCYSCGAHGDAIDLYQKLNHCSFLVAVKAMI